MSVLTEYFVAATPEVAAAVIDDGPSSNPDLGVVARWSGLDPVVIMNTLQGLLTGATFTEILASDSQDDVAIRDGGMKLVLPIHKGLQAALVSTDLESAKEHADAWAQTEELTGADPKFLRTVIADLRNLAVSAEETGGTVYCWICV